MDVFSWLCSGNYRTYNVLIAKKLESLNAAVYLSELCQRFIMHSQKNELISNEKHGDGWFYYTSEKCEERTSLTSKEQRTCISLLESLGLIQTVNFGLPCKRYFKVIEQALSEFCGFSNNISSYDKRANKGDQEKGKQDVPKGQTALYIEEPKEEPYKESSSSRKKDDDDLKKSFSSSDVIVTKTNGKQISMSQSDIYQHFLRLPYETEVVKEAIARIMDNPGPINNILSYLEATCASIKKTKPCKNTPNHDKIDERKSEVDEPKEVIVNWGEYVKRLNSEKKNE